MPTLSDKKHTNHFRFLYKLLFPQNLQFVPTFRTKIYPEAKRVFYLKEKDVSTAQTTSKISAEELDEIRRHVDELLKNRK